MKTLAQLWAEKKTPFIRVRHEGWDLHSYFEVHALTDKYAFGFIVRDIMDTGTLFHTKSNASDWTLIPTTRRVYQALIKVGRDYFIAKNMYLCLSDAQVDLNSVSIDRKVIRLIEPGFEVPAE